MTRKKVFRFILPVVTGYCFTLLITANLAGLFKAHNISEWWLLPIVLAGFAVGFGLYHLWGRAIT